MLNNKLLSKIFLKNHFKNFSCFSKRKGLEENIKSKQSKKALEKNQNPQSPSSQGLIEVSKMKLLNMQFFPMALLLTPSLFSLEELYDPTFLLGELLVQKYATFALLMNLDFQSDKRKTFVILGLMASLHTLTGYYSIITPFGMALLSILSPFKFCEQKQKLSEIESLRMKTMTNIRILYFFIFALLTTVKALHYEATYSIQTKLNKIDQQNLEIKTDKQSL